MSCQMVITIYSDTNKLVTLKIEFFFFTETIPNNGDIVSKQRI